MASAFPGYARETGFREMHTGDQQPLGGHDIQQPRSCRGRKLRILIERDRHLRTGNLNLRKVDDVAPDQQAVGACIETIARYVRRCAPAAASP